MFSTCTISSSLSSIRKGPSTEASLKAEIYCPKDNTSNHLETSTTDQFFTLLGRGLTLTFASSFSAILEAASSVFFFSLAWYRKSPAPRFNSLILGRFAAAAADAEVAAEGNDDNVYLDKLQREVLQNLFLIRLHTDQPKGHKYE
jgi:hypothetical protein